MPSVPDGHAGAFFLWTDASGIPQWMTFDCVLREEWNEDAAVTEHPVETGADVADHVRVQLPTVSLTIFSTNEPIEGNDWTDMTFQPLALTLAAPEFVPASGIVNVKHWENNIEIRALAAAFVGLVGGGVGGAGGNAVGSVAGSILAGELLPGEEVILPVITDAGLQPRPPRTVAAYRRRSRADHRWGA